MVAAYKDLSKIPNDAFKLLVREWVNLETAYNFEKAGALKSKNRPTSVHWWISRKRPSKVPNDITPENFDTEFKPSVKAWWRWLQPVWRLPKDDEQPLLRTGGDSSWDRLRVRGINGLFSVLSLLSWWYQFADGNVGADWEELVDDVCWVVSSLIESI